MMNTKLEVLSTTFLKEVKKKAIFYIYNRDVIKMKI